MKCSKRFLSVPAMALIAAMLLAVSSLAWAGEPEAVSKDSRYMFIDEVKPGMKGYGLTVFSGTKIEKFDVEIVGVIYNVDPRSDFILARVSGGPIDKTGVIAGMSGSPVYIDGRIIGALAYSWPFAKEAIAGITPIGEMLGIFNFEKEKEERSITKLGKAEPGWAHTAKLDVPLPSSMSESAVMQPIMTPMVFSGFSREAVDFFRPQLEGWGIVPAVGGSSSGRMAEIDAPFEEGAAIGVQLVRGDLSASAIGTVTVKEDGGRVLAFGHPFMLSGSVDFPMTTAYVHTVLPSLFVSTKLGTALKSVGSLTQDRSSGIAGQIGGSPEMIPVTLRVLKRNEPIQTFDFEVVRSRQLLPPMVGMALSSSFSRASSATGRFAATVHYDIELDGYPTISNDDFVSGLSGFPSLATLGLFRDLTSLLTNQFKELSIRSISMTVDVREAVESAQITGVRLWKDTLRPGEDIKLKIIMQPYMKDCLEKDFDLTVPENFPEGQAFLQISAAPQTEFFERMRNPYHFQPCNIDKLVELVNEDYPGNRVDVRLLVADSGIVIDGEEMPALPSSVFSVISQTMGKEAVGITRSSVLLEKALALDFEVSGSITIPITISRRSS